MKATRLKSIDRAFVLHPNQIRKIMEIMEDGGKKIGLKVACVGGLSLEPSSFEELLSIPNIGDYKIETLRIESWGDPVITATFTLGPDSPIILYVSGEDEEVVKTHERLLREVSQVYGGHWPYFLDPFVRGKNPMIAFILGAVGSGSLSLLFRWQHLSFLVFLGYCFLSYCLITLGSSFFIRAFFSKGVFLIGAGIQEFDIIKGRRETLSPIAIVVAFVFAVLAAIGLHFFGW